MRLKTDHIDQFLLDVCGPDTASEQYLPCSSETTGAKRESPLRCCKSNFGAWNRSFMAIEAAQFGVTFPESCQNNLFTIRCSVRLSWK